MDETTSETSIEMNNIAVDCGRLGCEDVGWIQLALDMQLF
jgi:hypothetical protein